MGGLLYLEVICTSLYGDVAFKLRSGGKQNVAHCYKLKI